jgi:glycosyltransferase involved in cell wall biosynthesis
MLAQSGKLAIKVFYTWEQSQQGAKFDPGFGKTIQWDIPLLEGYDYSFIKNTAADPGTHHFKGVINPSLNKEVESWKPDVLLVFGWSFSSHLSCMRYFHGRLPVLFRGDSTLLNDRSGIKKGLRRLFLRWVYRHIDYALYVGINNKDYFLANGIKEDQLVFIPHAVDNLRFAEPQETYESQAKEWRNKVGLSENDLVILYAGKLEPVKAPFFLLKVAASIERADIKFLLVGNGVLEPELKEKARSDKRIVFLDFQNQKMMPVVYRVGDIFILPSCSETWGLAANEAMACSRPVMLSAKTGGGPDLVREGINGIVFDNDDVHKCVKFINRLADDRSLLRQMGENSAQRIQQFDFEKNSAILIEFVTNRI